MAFSSMTTLNIVNPLFPAILALVIGVLSSYLFSKRLPQPRTRYLLFGLEIVIIAALFILILRAIFGADQLPSDILILTVPLAVVIVLLHSVWEVRPITLGAGFANIALTGLLCLTLANDFYHYFPTLGSLFNASQSTAPYQSKQITTTQKQSPASPVTLEGAIYNQPTNPTYAGTLTQVAIPAPKSQFKARPAYIYVPYIESQATSLDLPVLFLLPGFPSFRGAADWTQGLNLQNILDTFARNHRGITPLVVALDTTGNPLNDTECVDSPAGNVETYLTVDVPAYIKSHYNVSTSPSNWGVGGLSMGGMCSAMLALKHPDIFRYFLDFGGESGPEVGSKSTTVSKLFGGSVSKWQSYQIDTLLADSHHYPAMGGYFLYGTRDSLKVNSSINRLFYAAKKQHFDVVKEGITGQHTFGVFEQGFKDALPWISNRLGATDCTTLCSNQAP